MTFEEERERLRARYYDLCWGLEEVATLGLQVFVIGNSHPPPVFTTPIESHLYHPTCIPHQSPRHQLLLLL